jgi:hypothetical protein
MSVSLRGRNSLLSALIARYWLLAYIITFTKIGILVLARRFVEAESLM